MTRIIKTLLH